MASRIPFWAGLEGQINPREMREKIGSCTIWLQLPEQEASVKQRRPQEFRASVPPGQHSRLPCVKSKEFDRRAS